MKHTISRLVSKFKHTKHNMIITDALFVLVLPIITAAFCGLLSACGERFFRLVLGQPAATDSFGDDFASVFFLFYPILILLCLITVIATAVKKRKKPFIHLIVLTLISLILLWFFGGGKLAENYMRTMEDQLSIEETLGDSFSSLGQSDDAIRNFKFAVFIDKYIVLWNDNKNIPQYYCRIGKAYANADDLTHANEFFEKALSAFDRYCPEEKVRIAYTHTLASTVTAALNDNKNTLAHADQAVEYYKNNTSEEYKKTIATAYLFLANAYFNDQQYAKASECFDIGIPMYYDSVNWGFGDESEAKMLAISYNIAAKANEKAGNKQQYENYDQEYKDFIWYRDFTEQELLPIIEYYHWLNVE